MTATGRRPNHETTSGGVGTDLGLLEHAAAQTEAMQVLLSLSVSPNGDHPEPAGAHNGGPPALLDAPAPEWAAAGSPLAPGEAPRGREAGRARAGGRHAAARPPYLDRRGVRFVVFSAIGGFVFLLGLGLQAVLTGRWQMAPLASYLIQAVVSVETSFLLNRWLTWRDRDTPFWLAFTRFNAQKTVTIALNFLLYAGLLRLGMNYLVANVALTAVFTVVNFVAGDRLVFIPGRRPPAEPAAPAVPAQVRRYPAPAVSAVIPCRDNERTIGAAVQSLLDQDYPGLREIMLIGSPGDSTWKGLAGVAHPRLTMWELTTPPGVRDANFKRDAAVKMTSGDLIALVDSDIVLGSDWLRRAVAELEDSGAGCVAGGMKSFHDSFWGRYTDSTWIGAKTPRVPRSYTVTSANFGARGRKPPILANTLFTRELYERCPIDPMWSHGSYEDYEWFWRVTKAGYPIRVCRELFGRHHHRRGLRALAGEYRRSARGCAYFIRAHPDSPLAKRRRRQAVVLPLAAAAGIAGAAAVTAGGYGRAVAGLLLAAAAVLAVHQVVRSRSLESVAYPLVGLTLGLVFTAGLVSNLIRPGTAAAAAPSPAPATQPGEPAGRPGSALPAGRGHLRRAGRAVPDPGLEQHGLPTRRTTSGWGAWSSRTGCTGHHGHRPTPTGSSPDRPSSTPRSAPSPTAPTAWQPVDRPPGDRPLAARHVMAIGPRLPGPARLAPHLPATGRPGQQRGAGRGQDPLAGLHARRDDPALPHRLAADRPPERGLRRCPVGVHRASDAAGLRHLRPAVRLPDRALGVAHRAGRVPAPSR